MRTLNSGDGLRGPGGRDQFNVGIRDLTTTYRCPDGVHNESSSTFMVLSSIRNQDRHLRVLVENLLNPTIVNTLPRVLLTGSAIIGLFGVAQVFWMGDEIRRVKVGIAAGGRGFFVLVQGYRGLAASPLEAGEELTRGEGSRV